MNNRATLRRFKGLAFRAVAVPQDEDKFSIPAGRDEVERGPGVPFDCHQAHGRVSGRNTDSQYTPA
jgi:hypothetical protein